MFKLTVLSLLTFTCIAGTAQPKKKTDHNDTPLVLKQDRLTGKYAYYNAKGKKILGDYWYAQDTLLKKYAIVSDPHPVLIDRTGKHIYNIYIFDNGADYESNGFIRMVKNGKIGYIDAKNYKLVITPQFKCAHPFENGKAKVSYDCETIKNGEYSSWKSDHWFYINKKGIKISN